MHKISLPSPLKSESYRLLNILQCYYTLPVICCKFLINTAMKKQIIFVTLCFTLLLGVKGVSQTRKAMDYLNVQGPVSFNGKLYKLDWSAHPAPDFYKQEYLPAGEATGKYKTMLLIDVLTGDKKVKEVAAQKIAELKQMQLQNPMVNYNKFENAATDEYMIDFLLTANDAAGNINIIERNVYRYKTFTTASGQKGVLLFGISTRAYANEVDVFLKALKNNKNELVNKVASFILPSINLKSKT